MTPERLENASQPRQRKTETTISRPDLKSDVPIWDSLSHHREHSHGNRFPRTIGRTRWPPPLPTEFDRNLHRRLNHSLTTQHVFDLGLRALPCAAMEFVRALIGMATLTVTGKFPSVQGDRENPDS